MSFHDCFSLCARFFNWTPPCVLGLWRKAMWVEEVWGVSSARQSRRPEVVGNRPF